jgi:hypothetical protein
MLKTEKPEIVLPASKSELRRLIANGLNKGWKRPLTEIIADLSKPLPSGLISWKPTFSKGQRKESVPYLSHSEVSQILDYLAPGWSKEISENQVGDRIVVRCRLSILAQEGIFTRDSLGTDSLGDESYGGPAPDAEAQAFRRAAANFGLGRYFYDKEIVKTMQRNKNTVNNSKAVVKPTTYTTTPCSTTQSPQKTVVVPPYPEHENPCDWNWDWDGDKIMEAPTQKPTIDVSDIIAQTTVEVKRLGWTNERGKDYLLQTYGKRSRQLLTDEELQDFLKRLKTMEVERLSFSAAAATERLETEIY